jgi:hypothetical protein
MLPKCSVVKDGLLSTRASRMGRVFGLYEPPDCLDRHPRWGNTFASRRSGTYSMRLVAHCLYKPNVPVAPAFAPTLCNRSPTFLFASKNLATHRSMQTLSPLLSSPSVYRVLTHFVWHVLKWGCEWYEAGSRSKYLRDKAVKNIGEHVQPEQSGQRQYRL